MRSSRVSLASPSGREARSITTAIHQGRRCEQCVLCQRKDLSKYTHPKSWKNPALLHELQVREPSLNIQADSCICLQCRKDINSLTDETFIPRWMQNKGVNSTVTVTECYVSNCTNKDIKVCKSSIIKNVRHFFLMDELEAALNSDTVADIPLCSHHYMKWYRHSHSSRTLCKTCNKWILAYSKSRHIPEPKIVQDCLNANTEFKDKIHPDDRVCFDCYKSHLEIIKHVQELVKSTDSDLSNLLDGIKQNYCDVHVLKIHCWEAAMEHAAARVALQVGEAILKQTAVLLTTVFQTFVGELNRVAAMCDIKQENIPSHVWLRSSLSHLLKHHMAYHCSIPKFGTLLYRYEGNMLHALTVALSKDAQTVDDSCEEKNENSIITKACVNINNRLQKQIKTLINSDSTRPHNIEHFNIDEFIKSLDPLVWRAMCLLTQASTKTVTHVRKMRTMYAVCHILFTINRQCSFPLHTLLADAIDTYSGSTKLKTLLNRLGICASTETHGRYIQYRVEQESRQKEGQIDSTLLSSPIIVSVDNLDYQQSFSRIYSGKQGCGWHGTTIQIPLHRIKISEPEGCDTACVSLPQPVTASHTSNTTCNVLKRTYSTRSPQGSSTSLSPKPKKLRRRRTGLLEKFINSSPPDSVTAENECTSQSSETTILTRNEFLLQEKEKCSLKTVKSVCEQYIVLKLANEFTNKSMLGLKMFYSLSENTPIPEKTEIVYFKVLDEKCDSNDTLLSVIHNLHTKFVLTGKATHVVLEGDQATYERLHCIRKTYADESKWLILFPGDWHFLKNYQEVLVKVYFDAGLYEMSKACGYLPRSISSCSNFKRTHRFLLESWEALYRVLMRYFVEKHGPDSFLQEVSVLLNNLPGSPTQTSAQRNLKELINTTYELFNVSNFESFINAEATTNETLKFWLQFLFQDCLAYLALYLGIRCSNWDLRMAAIKVMGPLFTSFDRPKYSKLIPLHIKEMLSLPKEIISHLQNGRFTVSILGRAGYSVGIDEAHEMSINKDCKEYITRPSAEHMTRITHFLPIRAKALKNLEKQLYEDSKARIRSNETTTLYNTEPENRKHEANVQAQVKKITNECKVLPSHHTQQMGTCTTLTHLFKEVKLRPEQINDLLKFREIGENTLQQYIDYFILKTPSIQPPKHRKSLLTFTEKRARQKKGSQVERERKIQLEVWKKRVSFSVTTGIPDNMSYRQCIELPRAIATTEGRPIKGSKATITKVCEKRYKHVTPPIITTTLKAGWAADTVISEGMFLINITPWSTHQFMGDYAQFLLKQHILPLFGNTTQQVHLLFDNPNTIQQTPKYFERLCRDAQNQVADDHTCRAFSADMIVPPKWRQNVLNCRKCKRSLVCFLSDFFIQKIKHHLKQGQRFVTAGGGEGDLSEKAMSVTSTLCNVDETLTSNAEESDSRIWLHVCQSAGQRKLVLSPDTDVYHIGMTLIGDEDVVVRLSPFNALEQRFLHLTHLLSCFKDDPELAGVEESSIPHIIQAMFICTGCDYISFFNGLGKTTFLQALFHYCQFITATTTTTTRILTAGNEGFLSFVRLVGCAYFKKHKTAFLPSFPNPETLFNSIQLGPNSDQEQVHSYWLQLMRDRIWTKIQYEEDMIPSLEALFRHWKRSCWVSIVWNQAVLNEINHPPLNQFGWKQSQDSLNIDWDSENNLTNIRHEVALIRKGCGCKSGCSSARCKCKKANNHCGPGCKCIGCTNLPQQALEVCPEESSDSETDSNSSENEESLSLEVRQLMQEIFGDSETESTNSI